ncbi:hypothetical protein [Nakamurella leprariae]|uniref:Uncharacterized protein n=1 Tax=Nakamurella leprariae TaxID=2803911 RepID=A0A938YIF0_9ACTN|nr:hypothetical protein [Nakamurella leprariae]MBM9468365.1 hypothetical protein [Nakamurella leprariae]
MSTTAPPRTPGFLFADLQRRRGTVPKRVWAGAASRSGWTRCRTARPCRCGLGVLVAAAAAHDVLARLLYSHELPRGADDLAGLRSGHHQAGHGAEQHPCGVLIRRTVSR